jgi:integrase
MGKLTAAAARTRVPGKYRDGHGLMLHVVSAEKRYWVFRYEREGKERAMSLGSADVIGLAEARELHIEARAQLAKGIDPLAERERAKAMRAKAVTFASAAERYVDAHHAGWRGRNEQLWRSSLAQHVLPVFGHKPVADITTEDVLAALRPIWVDKNPTAAILRSRLEAVLSFARARSWRAGENPARWRDNLDHLLPAKGRVHQVEHRAALPWAEAPGLFAQLAASSDLASRCLALVMLTCVRSGEARLAVWDEIDVDAAVWTIPAPRMKTGREHRVPLSEPALDLLRELAELRTSKLVFEGHTRGRPLGETSLRRLLRRLGYGACSVHGLRSTFAQWCQDTGKPADLCEAALAHQTGNAVRRVYARSDVLEPRRELMQAWAAFLNRRPADVVPLRASA